jgi:superfamily I DNA and RNA helicase
VQFGVITITEFGALKRKQGESISDFTKRFNKMYSKILDEIKPSETSAKITFVNAFDVEFSLLLRERRYVTLSLIQEVAIEVESNILAADKLNSRGDRDWKKQKEEIHSSSHTTSYSKMDEMDKMLKTLTSKMARLKMEQKNPCIPTQEGGYITLIGLGGQIMYLKYYQERERIKKIKKFCLLSKIMQ